MTCISLSWIYMALLDDLQCMPNGTGVTAFGNASQIWMSSGLAWILPVETGGNVVFQYFLRSLQCFIALALIIFQVRQFLCGCLFCWNVFRHVLFYVVNIWEADLLLTYYTDIYLIACISILHCRILLVVCR